MELEWKYLTETDQTAIHGLLQRQMPVFAPVAPKALYHYTRGENLINIFENKQLWATHISCLNDMKEWLYGVEEVHRHVKDRLSEGHSQEVEPVLKRLDEYLSNPIVELSPAFVACFSEQEDDLSQWRAYSGGEGGYAIRFDPLALAQS